MWHAKTFKHKLQAWAKNKTLSFVISAVSLGLTISALATWTYDNFIKQKTAVVQPHNTGNAVTSGPQSPAISGDGNSVTYDQPDTDKKKKINVKAQHHEPIDNVTAHVSRAPAQYAPGGINIGGNNQGTAIVNNIAAPSLQMTASVESVTSDKEGLLKTVVTVVPNVPVSAPTGVALEFDNPIMSISFSVRGAAGVMGGGPYRLGTHALISIGTGFNPQHPLEITVYSEKPVSLLKDPVLE
ncbi:MAG TPA: hypothetical protein VJN89_23235 [Candidatus Acidoferrum sp.]|nr:hypothetical protein [Candidatus Acidoferrum sp.]